MDEKQKHPDALLLQAEQVNLTDLAQIFDGGGLFGESKFVFIEQFVTKKKKNTDFKDIIAYLEKNADEHNIYLWENKELEVSSLKAFKNASAKAFKLPQSLFAFLDAIKPGNGKVLVKLFHQTIETAEVEMTFFMLVRQVRLLLALSRHSGEEKRRLQNPDSGQARMTYGEIDELKRLTWQRGKMQKQAEAFSQTGLLSLYHKLFLIESAQKTGMLTSPLIATIDFLLLNV